MNNNANRLAESKAQRWRALAVRTDGTEALLCMGGSIVQVRELYLDPWNELFTEEERRYTAKILVQKWNGSPDCGSWENQTKIPIPLSFNTKLR